MARVSFKSKLNNAVHSPGSSAWAGEVCLVRRTWRLCAAHHPCLVWEAQLRGSYKHRISQVQSGNSFTRMQIAHTGLLFTRLLYENRICWSSSKLSCCPKSLGQGCTCSVSQPHSKCCGDMGSRGCGRGNNSNTFAAHQGRGGWQRHLFSPFNDSSGVCFFLSLPMPIPEKDPPWLCIPYCDFFLFSALSQVSVDDCCKVNK